MKYEFKPMQKIDSKSLRFKLWAYFALFAIMLMAILWCLQILFLQTYYQHMKTKEIIGIGNTLAREFNQVQQAENFTEAQEQILSLFTDMQQLAYERDLYIRIVVDNEASFETTSQSLEVAERGNMGRGFFPNKKPFDDNINELGRQLQLSPLNVVTRTFESHDGTANTMGYAQSFNVMDSTLTISIIARLTPVESTISILASQLIYVTAVSLLLSFVISLWLSRRITKPLIRIKNSARKMAEGQYEVTFDGGRYTEIISLADTLNYTAQELAKADNLQKDLIANVSHDLRTPLTMVKSYAEMVRDLSGDNPVKRNDHLQVIIDEADRLNMLVSDLLVLSKMQSGVETLRLADLDLKEMVENLLKTYWILEEQDGYQFQFDCNTDTPVYVKGDESRLKQVLSNLINNAVRHGGESRNVKVALEVAEGVVRLSVTDKGPGIPKDELDHIWQRYYRTSSTGSRAVSGGSGLGLSIVREILCLHKAKFGVDSELGTGSTFWFELPLSSGKDSKTSGKCPS